MKNELNEMNKTINGYDITTIVNGAWEANCYLVRHHHSAGQTVIDPGGNAVELIELIRNKGSGLSYLLLTHAHHDHMGAADALSREFQLPCMLHQDDRRLLRHAPMYAQHFEQRSVSVPENVDAFCKELSFDIGNDRIAVMHTPGHTPGSVCYVFPGFIFTGDTLMSQSIGRTDLPGGSLPHLEESINRLTAEIEPDTVIFPGHGSPWTGGEARQWWTIAANKVGHYQRVH